MTTWLRCIADLLFPIDCDACARPLSMGSPTTLCDACLRTIRPPPLPLCPRCGAPARPGAACRDCLRIPLAFASARALGLYLSSPEGLNPLAAAVHALKFRGRRGVAAVLGARLAEAHPFVPGALVVPVPLHPARLRSRGYNQALLLARPLARRRALPLAPRALRRLRATPAQQGLGATRRTANLVGAFVVRDPALVRGRRIALIDDVLTTGATAHACAVALLEAGATGVDVYTVGRTP